MPRLMLVDNGSSRAASTLTLRRLAEGLGERLGVPVAPVSLQHSDKVPAADLGGRAADTLPGYLRGAAAEGERDFVAVPLFFGPSRALSQFIPETAAAVGGDQGPLSVLVAEPLCPLPQGEPRLAQILADQVSAAAAGARPTRVVLVDHGSPIPEVTAVRRWLAGGLDALLRARWGEGLVLSEAVMERRAGAAYDFNGSLLADHLDELARAEPAALVILSLLFLAPGRHAGAGGDIADICAAAQAAHPRLRMLTSALVGAHPLLLDILADRAREALVAQRL